MNETINDIIREMREDWAMTYFSERTKKKNGDYSDVAAIGSQTVAERIESAHKREMLRMESLLQKAGETVVGLMNKVNAQDAALKPIIDFNPDKDGLCPQELRRGLAYCAVREAQRIYKEVKLRMKNFEKYKTAADRAVAFQAFCSGNSPCDKCQLKDTTMGSECAFEWLDLDAEEGTPMDCPFCGGNVVKESGKLKCSAPLCGYSLMLGRDPDKTVAAHNRVCRAVKEANA